MKLRSNEIALLADDQFDVVAGGRINIPGPKGPGGPNDGSGGGGWNDNYRYFLWLEIYTGPLS